MRYTHFKLSYPTQNLCEVTFDMEGEKINKLSFSVLDEFNTLLEDLEQNTDLKIVLFKSAKKNIFIAGADINEILAFKSKEQTEEKLRLGHKIFNRLEALRPLTVAFIDGACLGGGMELALCCDVRLALNTPATKLGLPEVSLGIIPGLGGTQRMPRLLGLINSLDLILSGRAINVKKAYKIGLVDEYIEKGYEEFALDGILKTLLQKGKEHFQKRHQKTRWLELLDFTKDMIFKKAKENVLKKTQGHYPAPLKALEVVKNTYGKTLSNGIADEIEAFCELSTDAISKNLIQLFFTSEELKKLSLHHQSENITNTAIVGAGTMGSAIAWLLVNKDHDTRLKIRRYEQIGEIYKKIFKLFSFHLKTRKLNLQGVEIKMNRLSYTNEYNGFQNVDVAIEAVVEDLGVKHETFEALEKSLPKEAIIASNTSSIDLDILSEALEYKERFVGIHFFNPVNRMPLVEVIPSKHTSAKTLQSTLEFIRGLGKTPIVVGNCAGFLVNRLLIPFINEAAHILNDGLSSVKNIDEAAKNFGMPLGAFRLADEVGLDVGYKVAMILENAYGERMKVAPILQTLYKQQGLLGKKANKGFYVYQGKNEAINEAVDALVLKKVFLNERECIERMMLVMINEASMCLEENIIENAKFLDMALILGAGFPAFRGGLLRYADTLGSKHIYERLSALEEDYGVRYKPSKRLELMAQSNEAFYKEV